MRLTWTDRCWRACVYHLIALITKKHSYRLSPVSFWALAYSI